MTEESLLPSPSEMLAEILEAHPEEREFWDWLADKFIEMELDLARRPNPYRQLANLNGGDE